MNVRFVPVLALGCLVLSPASLPAQHRERRRGDEAAAQFGWVSSLEEGKKQAEKTGKPLLVVIRCVP
jgi:hypothetical protein